jgi:biotin carboxylase
LGIKLLKALNWYGVAMVEFKMDPRDGKLKFLEINPRFWGSLPLAIASGVDFPYLLYRMAMDGDIEPVLKYKVGVKCRNLIKDVRCWESAMRDNFTHLGLKIDRVKFTLDFLKFYEKKLHYDLISLDDWMPMVVEIRNFLARKLKGESK